MPQPESQASGKSGIPHGKVLHLACSFKPIPRFRSQALPAVPLAVDSPECQRCNEALAQFVIFSANMKSRLFLLVPTLAITLFGQSSAADGRASLERTVKEFFNIQNAGDVTAFEKWCNQHLLDTFSCVTTAGSLANKDAMTRNYGRMISAGGFHDQVSETNIAMVSDRTAVVTEVHETTAKSTSGQTRTSRMRTMNVWVNEGGMWRIAGCAGATIASPNSTTGTSSAPK